MDPGPSVYILPTVSLSALDEQYLFEIGVRLAYSADVTIIEATLDELLHVAARDYPPEAILAKSGLIDTLLAVGRQHVKRVEVLGSVANVCRLLLERGKEAARVYVRGGLCVEDGGG